VSVVGIIASPQDDPIAIMAVNLKVALPDLSGEAQGVR
jgi:hypothetical protein